MMDTKQGMIRKGFMIVFAILALYAIPFTRAMLATILDYKLFGDFSIIAIVGVASFYGIYLISQKGL